jgi:hypothetical protein
MGGHDVNHRGQCDFACSVHKMVTPRRKKSAEGRVEERLG